MVQLDYADNMLCGKFFLDSFTHIIVKHSGIFFYAADRLLVQILCQLHEETCI